MFIELTEILRCPRPHEPSYMICAPMTMDQRRVVRGVVSCPACQTDFPIIDGVLFLAPPGEAAAATGALTADAAQTFLGLEGAGGYLLLIGSAGRLAPQLRDAHVIALNPPPGVTATGTMSLVRAQGVVPLKQPSVRGAVIGAEAATAPWLAEAAASVLPGLRLVIEREGVEIAGMTAMASGAGISVFEKTG